MDNSASGAEAPQPRSMLARFVAKAIAWCRSNLFLVFLGTVGVVGLSASQTMAWLKQQQDIAQFVRVSNMPELGLNTIFASIEAKKVKALVSHELTRQGLAGSSVATYIEVVFKDGSSASMEVVPEIKETMWKGFVDLAKQQQVVIKEGYKVHRPIPYKPMVDGVVWISLGLLAFLLLHRKMTEGTGRQAFQAKGRDKHIRLADVIGYDDVKREMHEVMDQLTRSQEYREQGIKPPRGVIFTGDPGVGKSMMAKAMANELDADFFYCTGADFAEMYVGVGPKRVKELFANARKSKIAFIFIDEIDALGSRQALGHDSERQATINQMLAELDGIQENGQILVLGATNHVDRMDPALLRPGRFDKQIHIPLPDHATRRGILEKYLGSVQIDGVVDLNGLAHRTAGFSGAQLRAMVNESKTLALRDVQGATDKTVRVSQELLERAQEIAILGISERRSEGDEAKRIAIHELGHALAGYLYCHDIHIEKVTTIGRGGALGYTLSRPLTEGALKTEDELRGDICMMLAGRAAEDVMFGSVSSGAVDDLRRANSVARKMVCQLGMGKSVGLVTPMDAVSQGHPAPASVDEDVRALLDEIYDQAKNMVHQHSFWMVDRAARLLESGLLGHDALFSDITRQGRMPLGYREQPSLG
jgi:cell division protease FtsH